MATVSACMGAGRGAAAHAEIGAVVVVSQGQRVWVKVVEVDANNKVGLSMKMVNQETGRDEDPDHFEALEAQGRKGGGG